MTDITTILTCDKCGLPYRASLIPHECAEWTKGRNKHKGDVMKRHDDEQPFSKQVAKMMVDYDTLVKQQGRLLRLLRPVTSPTACYCAVMRDEKCWHCEARELIATIEQPSPSTTGDEQGGRESDSEQSR